VSLLVMQLSKKARLQDVQQAKGSRDGSKTVEEA
jgi:hypothetical protein